MDEGRSSGFGGVTGRVLSDAMSFGTVVTGIVLAVVILAESFVLGLVGATALAQVVTQIVVAIALARFALNGMAGETRGTLFSSAGGSWALALGVAGRYVALNALWMIPLALIAWQAFGSALGGGTPVPPEPGATVSGGGAATILPLLGLLGSKPFWACVGLLLFGITLLPPVFLIVAVRSESFGDLFSLRHWRDVFAGRGADLYAIYAVYTGGLGMMIVLAIPLILIGFAAGTGIGILFVATAMTFACGLAVSLLGRLCGVFAFGVAEGGPAQVDGAIGPTPEPPVHARPAGAGVVPHPAAASPARSAAAAPAVAPAAAAGTPIATAGTSAGAEAPDHPEGDSGRPPLPDAAQRVAAALGRFESDQGGAIGDLDEMRRLHAPIPQVMHALVLCLHRAGRAGEAVLAAREALPLCLARGHVALAAEMFAALWKSARELGLEREQIDTLGAALYKSGDLGRSTSAYGLALTMDRADRKAIKGLMQIADHRMHRDGRPRDAARIYTFLLQYASDSPFAADMKQGLAEAEARAARAS